MTLEKIEELNPTLGEKQENLEEKNLMEKKPQNFGFLPPPTMAEEPTQWLAGTIPFQINREKGDWFEVRISGETQSFKLFDAMSCVSGAWTNSEEKQIQNFIENGYYINGVRYEIDVEKIKDWFDTNGKINLSERFLAKTSGTTRQGNNPYNVLEARRKYGLPPESMWSLQPFITGSFNWDEYYKSIPKSVYDKALEWTNYFEIQYERMTDLSREHFKKVLQQCPIFWASATCPGWMTNDIVKTCTQAPNHMTIGEGLEWGQYMWDYDTYDPFDKKLAWNYNIYFPYKAIVIPKPSILKKKPSEDGEGENMQFAKKLGTPNIYVKGIGDGLYHRIYDESTFTKLFGNFEDNVIPELDIAESWIAEPLGLSDSFLKSLVNWFNSLRGRN